MAQSNTFQKIYFGIANEVVLRNYEHIQTHDNGFLYGSRLRLVKCDSIGNLEWMKKFDNPDKVFAAFESCHNNTGYLTGGGPFIMKLDTNFNIEWTKEFLPTNEFFFLFSIKKVVNGYICGGNYTFGQREKYFLMKIDTAGIVIWAKSYQTSAISDSFSSMIISDDNGYIISGTSSIINGSTPIALGTIFKTDSSGYIQWCKSMNYSTSTFTYKITGTSDSGCVIAGRRDGHKFLIKLDSLGNKIWFKNYISGIDGDAYSVSETGNMDLIVTGMTSGIDSIGFYETALLMKANSNGDLYWSKLYNNYGYNTPGYVSRTNDGGFLINSRTVGPSGEIAFNLIKTDSMGLSVGCTTTEPTIQIIVLNDTLSNGTLIDSIVVLSSYTSIAVGVPIGNEITLCSSTGIGELFYARELITVIPNPSNGEFTITIQSNVLKKWDLEIYDITGNRILYSAESTGPGVNQILISQKIMPGIYNLKLTSKDIRYIKKLVVL